jgi:hypothetical protein
MFIHFIQKCLRDRNANAAPCQSRNRRFGIGWGIRPHLDLVVAKYLETQETTANLSCFNCVSVLD